MNRHHRFMNLTFNKIGVRYIVRAVREIINSVT